MPEADTRTSAAMAIEAMSRAQESYRRDNRFRMIAQSCVAAALHERGRVDPERADGDAYEIALLATATLLQRIYEDDAELNALRAERDAFLEQALNGARFFAPPQLVVRDSGSEPKAEDAEGG